MKKLIKNIFSGLIYSNLVIIPTTCALVTSQQPTMHSKLVSLTNSSIDGLNVTYEFGQCRQHGIYCCDERKEWDYLYWNNIEDGQNGAGFVTPYWCEPSESNPESPRFKFATDGANTNDRFVYQQIKVNVAVPANVENYKVDFYTNFYQWADNNASFLWTDYFTSMQLFNFEDDANGHPEKFNNLIHKTDEVDSYSVYEGRTKNSSSGFFDNFSFCDNYYVDHFWSFFPKNTHYVEDVNVPCESRHPFPKRTHSAITKDPKAFSYDSDKIQWTFSNNTSETKIYSKYIGVSWWIMGVNTNTNGNIQSDVKVQLNAALVK